MQSRRLHKKERGDAWIHGNVGSETMQKKIHKRQWRLLKKAYRADSLSHAYLFSGERGLGKKDFASRFIKFALCDRREKAPCGECGPCRMIEKGTHPDVFLLGDEKKKIPIGEVRELRRKISLRPSFSSLKAGLVKRAHVMKRPAQNSLLKTLEEPKGNSLLILTTDKPHLLLATVRSRLQTVKFFPASEREIRRLLRKQGAGEGEAARIASLSQGKIKRAMRFLRDKDLLEKEEKSKREMQKVFRLGLGERFEMAKSLAKKKPEETLLRWLRYSRALFLEEAETEGGVELFGKRIRALEKSLYLLSRTNANKKIILQNLMLKL